MLQTKVKPLECAVYLQKSKNMARKDLLLACTLVLCKSNRKHQDWFDDTDKKAKALLEERNNARVKKQDKTDWYSTKSTAVQKGNEVSKVGGKGWRIAADSRKKKTRKLFTMV